MFLQRTRIFLVATVLCFLLGEVEAAPRRSRRARRPAHRIARKASRTRAAARLVRRTPTGRAGPSAALWARRYVGVRYVWGGATPRGFDCSGLTMYCYRKAGRRIPRTASQQFRYGRPVATNALSPGDLLFFWGGRRIAHVGMWVGGGRIIHAPRPGRRVTNAAFSGWFRKRFAGARRY